MSDLHICIKGHLLMSRQMTTPTNSLSKFIDELFNYIWESVPEGGFTPEDFSIVIGDFNVFEKRKFTMFESSIFNFYQCKNTHFEYN